LDSNPKGVPVDHNVSEWKVRHLRRPDQEPVLEITGETRIPATYRAVLKPAEDQGDDPSQLVLDLIINVPSGLPAAGMETRGTLFISYKSKTDQAYNTVKIVDVNADADTTGDTEWVLPVKQINWATTAQPPASKRWKGDATAHRQH
jgi:hypothetical protein